MRSKSVASMWWPSLPVHACQAIPRRSEAPLVTPVAWERSDGRRGPALRGPVVAAVVGGARNRPDRGGAGRGRGAAPRLRADARPHEHLAADGLRGTRDAGRPGDDRRRAQCAHRNLHRRRSPTATRRERCCCARKRRRCNHGRWRAKVIERGWIWPSPPARRCMVLGSTRTAGSIIVAARRICTSTIRKPPSLSWCHRGGGACCGTAIARSPSSATTSATGSIVPRSGLRRRDGLLRDRGWHTRRCHPGISGLDGSRTVAAALGIRIRPVQGAVPVARGARRGGSPLCATRAADRLRHAGLAVLAR